MKNTFLISLIIFVFLGSCANQDWEFPDYEFQSVYFAYQYPVRTITLGDDIFDTTLDNLWRCKIMATTGGVYSNDNDIIIDFVVDNTLTENLRFGAAGANIIPMPSNYYTLSSNQIIIPAGNIIGGVTVQLTADFFADPASIRNTYVIPIRMTDVVNADTILRGRPAPGIINPSRTVTSDWAVQPKDFILYAVRYVNPWHGFYLRRGVDSVTNVINPALNTIITRRAEFVERDEVVSKTTRSLNQVAFPIRVRNRAGVLTNLDLIVEFDDAGVARVFDESANFDVVGSGRFVSRGERNSWGGQDRDAIYLEYQIDFDGQNIATKDTLVLRNRGVHMEVFTPVLVPLP